MESCTKLKCVAEVFHQMNTNIVNCGWGSSAVILNEDFLVYLKWMKKNSDGKVI